MGLFDRLQKALGLGESDQPAQTWAPAAGAIGSDDPEPSETLALFVHRMNRLSEEQWRSIDNAWRETAADPARSAARLDAERRAEELGREHHRTVEMHSEVHVEYKGPGGRLLGEASPGVRKRVEAMEAELRARSDIRRDALLALANRADLTDAEFRVLYAPFEPFIPRATLERDATDWAQSPAPPRTEPTPADAEPRAAIEPDPGAPGPEVTSSLAPREPDATPAASDPADPWRDVRWSDEEPPTRS